MPFFLGVVGIGGGIYPKIPMKFSKAKAILQPPSTRLVEDEVEDLKTARWLFNRNPIVKLHQQTNGVCIFVKMEYEGMMHHIINNSI